MWWDTRPLPVGYVTDAGHCRVEREIKEANLHQTDICPRDYCRVVVVVDGGLTQVGSGDACAIDVACRRARAATTPYQVRVTEIDIRFSFCTLIAGGMTLYRNPIVVAEPYEDVRFLPIFPFNRPLTMHCHVSSRKAQNPPHRPRRRNSRPSTKIWRG